jgi:hypothetical protein
VSIPFHGVLAPNAKLRPQIIPSAPVNATDDPPGHAETPQSSAPVRLSWARLLKRVFDIDLEHCPNCGGALNDHRRHLRAYCYRQNPLPSRLTYPRTAARTRAALRAPPNRLIANHAVQLPEPTAPFDPRPRATPNRPENRPLGRRTGPQTPQFSSVTSRH